MGEKDTVPEDLPPDKREPEGPVGWLLGPQFIAALKWMLLYTAFGTKLDARDWMKATVFPPGGADGALYAWYDRARKHPENEKLQAKDAKDFWEQKGEFWFDYMADTGDGQTATYSIAYLCLNTLWAKKPWEAKPPADAGRDSKYPDGNSDLVLDHKVNPERTELTPLPRGEFLFVGGDISYHMSDYLSLYTRFQVPFSWAFKDFTKEMERSGRKFDAARRPLFGIPGNHDYYDMLDGFRRQFRRPVHTEDKDFQKTKDKTTPQLIIPGYERQQESSYMAIRLPFDWWFWALDTEVGEIDERQKKFFRGLNKDLNKGLESEILPDKLIVATCAPTTVFGQYAKEDDEKASLAFLQLGLPRIFLRGSKQKMAKREVERSLGPNQIRLDISGDIHHYARYWGPPVPSESEDDETTPRQERKGIKAERPERKNYASVVSGMGGAFLHPTTTYKDEVREQVLYPPETQSRSAVADRIFNPLHVMSGGYVWLIGGLIAFLLYLILAAVPSTRQSINSFSPLVCLGITQEETVGPTVRPLVEREHEAYYTGKNALRAPRTYYAGLTFAFLSLILIAATFIACEVRHARLKKKEKREKRAYISIDKFNELVLPMGVATIIVIALTLVLLKAHRVHMTPFANSAMVLLSMLWGLSAMALSFRYSDWLFEHAANGLVGKSRWIPRVLIALGFAAPVFGLWLFGRNNQPAYLFTDILFILLVSVVTVLLIYAAASMGGQMLGWRGKLLMGLGGLWHALLQIVLPLLLIRRGTWLTLLLMLLAVLIFMKWGEKKMREGQYGRLVVLGLFYGALMLMLPYLTILLLVWLMNFSSIFSFLFWPQAPVVELNKGWFATYEWWALGKGQGSLSLLVQSHGWWWALLPAFLAGMVGALMSCVWFGWYLAISLGFNGHNNEAGGAARIEEYKEFVRIRLTKDSLTAYVIAVDTPKIKGRELQPRLIDVFTLRAADDAGASSQATKPHS